MFKSRSGLPHVPVRARLELGCTPPSQAIMAAWLIALEATRAPDWCRAGELQHHVVGSAHAVMTNDPVYGAQVTAHPDSHAGGTRTCRVSAAGMRLAIAYVAIENGRVIVQLQRRLRRRHGEGGALERARRANAIGRRRYVQQARLDAS